MALAWARQVLASIVSSLWSSSSVFFLVGVRSNLVSPSLGQAAPHPHGGGVGRTRHTQGAQSLGGVVVRVRSSMPGEEACHWGRSLGTAPFGRPSGTPKRSRFRECSFIRADVGIVPPRSPRVGELWRLRSTLRGSPGASRQTASKRFSRCPGSRLPRGPSRSQHGPGWWPTRPGPATKPLLPYCANPGRSQ